MEARASVKTLFCARNSCTSSLLVRDVGDSVGETGFFFTPVETLLAGIMSVVFCYFFMTTTTTKTEGKNTQRTQQAKALKVKDEKTVRQRYKMILQKRNFAVGSLTLVFRELNSSCCDHD